MDKDNRLSLTDTLSWCWIFTPYSNKASSSHVYCVPIRCMFVLSSILMNQQKQL